jgi:butyryl-CoA dehydrogenase
MPLCDIDLVDVRVPASNLIGTEGRGFRLIMRVLNAVRPIVAARGLGLTARMIMGAVSYLESRAGHGGALIDLPTTRGALGDLGAELEAGRLLAYRAAATIDRGGLGKNEAALLAASKLFGTELAVRAATSCMHLCGAAGYDEALPFARGLRDAQQLTIVEGVSEVQRELVTRGLVDRTLWWA